MTVLKSKLNPRSEEFKSNAAAMRVLVDDLRENTEAVARGVSEDARNKHLARGKLLASARTHGARCAQLGEHLAILCAISHHCNTCMVFGRPTHQRRAANINQLDAWFCIKWIQAHHQQINRRNIVSLYICAMRCICCVGQNAAVHRRVQRHHAMPKNRRIPRYIGDVDNGQRSITEKSPPDLVRFVKN